MHYVKQFHINGVDTKQVACVELHGKPNAATEGAVGVLGMDVSSPTHEVYKCVAVNGSVYTWELLSAGMSIMSSTDTGEGALTKTFDYTSLLAPDGYLIKSGDLILDSEGYLYRVTAIGSDACETSYCGTHIGGIANGDKDYTFTIKDGKLRLVTESGAVVSEVDALIADDDTIYRDSSTGTASVLGIKTVNGGVLHLFVGTKEEYHALTNIQKQDLFAIITDDETKEEILSTLNAWRNGTEAVAKATKLAPVIDKTITGSADGLVLDSNSVYLVTVANSNSSEFQTSMILSIGDSNKSGTIFVSTVGSANRNNAKLYHCEYWNTSGTMSFHLYEMIATEGTDDNRRFSEVSLSGLTVRFIKIADYPT